MLKALNKFRFTIHQEGDASLTLNIHSIMFAKGCLLEHKQKIPSLG